MNKPRQSLTQGLSASIAQKFITDPKSVEYSQTLSIQQIQLPAKQPRRYFAPDKQSQLVQSIKDHGVLEPLLVRPLKNGTYELVAGERRYRAAQEIGLSELPVALRSKPNAAEKPQHLEKSKAKRTSPDKKRSKLPQQPKQQGQLTKSDDDEELAPERCQHIQFFDCDKQVGRVVFECWHCQQGIISEYTGEPVMGEYKGHPSLIQVKVQCPNCEQTAIRLTTGQVVSTTAIPSPWQQ